MNWRPVRIVTVLVAVPLLGAADGRENASPGPQLEPLPVPDPLPAGYDRCLRMTWAPSMETDVIVEEVSGPFTDEDARSLNSARRLGLVLIAHCDHSSE